MNRVKPITAERPRGAGRSTQKYGSLQRRKVRPLHTITNRAIYRRRFARKERMKFNSDLTATLTKSLKVMMTHTSSERGRSAVPLITQAQGISPFPVKIIVKVGGIEVPS